MCQKSQILKFLERPVYSDFPAEMRWGTKWA